MARLTQRDRYCMDMVDGQGFLTTTQWARCMSAEYSLASRRVRKLENEGLVRQVRTHSLTVSPIVLTQQGCDVVGTSLAPLPHVRVSQFQHDATVTDLALDLLVRFGPGATWISERRLRQIQPDAGHAPDGILRRADGDVAIEVELTAKSPARLEAILAHHAANLSINECWYFINSDAVATLVRRLAKAYPRIRIVRFNPRASRG